jgi:hypothetical protein
MSNVKTAAQVLRMPMHPVVPDPIRIPGRQAVEQERAQVLFVPVIIPVPSPTATVVPSHSLLPLTSLPFP